MDFAAFLKNVATVTLLLLAGLVTLVAALREIRLNHRLQRQGIRVRGTVIRHHREVGENGRAASLVAVVGFADANGNRHERRFVSPGTRRRPIGLAVPVVYLPHSPSTTARIDLRSERQLRIIGTFVGSAAFIGFLIAHIALG